MSVVVTRLPLEQIGMNGQKRRSARISQEHEGGDDYPAKKSRTNGASSTTTTSTTQEDGGTNRRGGRKKNKMYDEKVDGFTFTKGKRKATGKEPLTKAPLEDAEAPVSSEPPNPPEDGHAPGPTVAPVPTEDLQPKTAPKKTRRKLPATPEREVEKPVRRSKRLSHETAAQSPPKPTSQEQRQDNPDRSPTPELVQPITIEKKRKHVGETVEEEKTKRFILSFADTPIIQRNKQMRKGSGDGRRRSSSGMRGRRASSLIDEGRGNALPHPEVPTMEFFKHISAELTEPRRMRCLVGWCATRALPVRSDSSKGDTAVARLEDRALQVARDVMEELSQDLMTRDTLNNWFGRDESEPLPGPPKIKPNPRNVANLAKVKELEQEIERLKLEKSEWDAVVESATRFEPPEQPSIDGDGQLSPVRTEVLDSPQRAIVEQLQAFDARHASDPSAIQQRLRKVTEDLEYTVDMFAYGVHSLNIAQNTAERVADRTLANAAHALEQREKQQSASEKPVDQMDVLRAFARTVHSQYRRP